jgi:hypothetical protein
VTTIGQLDDPDPSLLAWFGGQEAAVAVLRPDRYLLAVARGSLDEVTPDCRPLLEPRKQA